MQSPPRLIILRRIARHECDDLDAQGAVFFDCLIQPVTRNRLRLRETQHHGFAAIFRNLFFRAGRIAHSQISQHRARLEPYGILGERRRCRSGGRQTGRGRGRADRRDFRLRRAGASHDGRIDLDAGRSEGRFEPRIVRPVAVSRRHDLTVAVDDDLRRDGGHAIQREGRPLLVLRRALLMRIKREAHRRVTPALEFHPVYKFLPLVPCAHREHHHPLGGIFRGDLLRVRHRSDAGRAPRRPKIEDQHLAPVVGQTDFLARQIERHKIRRHHAYSQCPLRGRAFRRPAGHMNQQKQG